jgi:hypothetical protein
LLDRLLPILDSINLSDGSKTGLFQELQAVEKRHSKLPSNNFFSHNAEISELMVSLQRCCKIRPEEEAVRVCVTILESLNILIENSVKERNEIIQEILLSIVSWLKELWILGVEFGVELEAVHNSLLYCQRTLIEIGDAPAEYDF